MLNDNLIEVILDLLNELVDQCVTLVFFLIVLSTSGCNCIQLDILTFARPPSILTVIQMNFSSKIICCIMCSFYENFFMDLSKVKMNCKYIALFKVHSISLSRLAVPMQAVMGFIIEHVERYFIHFGLTLIMFFRQILKSY